VKKSFLSPVTSLLVSLSLALGILVCNMSDYGFLTTAHACGADGSGVTVIGQTWTLDQALAPNGVIVQNILVNGQIVEAGVIAGPVQLVSGSVVNANGVLVGNEEPGAATSGTDAYGVLVGNEAPCLEGVLVGNEEPGAATSGTDAYGVLVGNEINVNGLIVSASGTASGGILTGDNISITGGLITGQNLLLSGATINGGFISMSGTITGVTTAPSN
jgi:hypothetical protein